jgi:glycine dehydrogenase subunit 1
LRNVAKLCFSKAHLVQDKLERMGFKALNNKPFYNEFLMKAPTGSCKKVLANLLNRGILGGLDLGNDKILICCTEMNSFQDIASYASVIKETVIRK